ncbi:DUF3325 family protein [Ideonella livida]|uniref:DUF3325 family protein n=1 Tax=Ideonella livida TaxID=2707176 RepID=A0A7C9TI54_9BURK|nr:DUF3325 family protein [Ideonella livida]NDY90122.1 DUF3325 family protein [Ideonella livida]
MSESSAWLLSAALLNLVGMGWLAMAMPCHAMQVWPGERDEGTGQRLLRPLGALALLAGLGACLQADRPSMAALAWVMLLSADALVVALVLSSRPRLLAGIWPWGR